MGPWLLDVQVLLVCLGNAEGESREHGIWGRNFHCLYFQNLHHPQEVMKSHDA